MPPDDGSARPAPAPEDLAEPYALPAEAHTRLVMFLGAAQRWSDAVQALSSLKEPSLEKQGRGAGSLTLRARELAGKYRQLLEAMPAGPSPEGPSRANARAPEWLGQCDGLREAVAIVSGVCDDVLDAVGRQEALDRIVARFGSDAMPSLTVCLKQLPSLQHHLTGLIWMEEYSR